MFKIDRTQYKEILQLYYKVVLHVLKFSFVFICCHSNHFLTCHWIEKWRKSFEFHDFSKIALIFGGGGGGRGGGDATQNTYYGVIMT